MTIRREVDWFGRIINVTSPLPGYSEILVNSHLFGNEIVQVRVDSEDQLAVTRGKYVVDTDSDILYPTQYKPEAQSTYLISRQAINRFDIRGRRNWKGLRVCYRWKPSPDDLDLFIEAAAGHRPIFSQSPL